MKYFKLAALVTLLVLMIGNLSAQELYWGLRAGAYGNRFLGKADRVTETEGCCSGWSNEVTSRKPGFGGQLGVFFEYELGDRGFLRPEGNIQVFSQHIDFNYQEGPWQDGVVDSVNVTGSLTHTKTVLEVPFLLKAELNDEGSSYLLFGIFATQLVSESISGVRTRRVVSSTSTPTVLAVDETLVDDAIPSEMIRGDGGLVLAYGMRFPVGEQFLETELRLRQGVWNQFAGTDFQLKERNLAVMVSVGYVFDLN